MATLRIAGLQTAGTPGNVEANLAELDSAAAEAAAAGARLLITPEMFLTGYDIGPGQVAEQALTPLTDRVAAVAALHGIAILAGLPEPSGPGTANMAVLIDAEGTRLASHAKTHLFGELDRSMFVPGHSPVTLVEYGGVKIAILICYDVEFPETVRAAALAGAQLIAVPTAQMEPFRFVADMVIPVRAWENQVYVAYINHVGQEGQTRYVGGSSICAPDGSALARSDRSTGLLLADIDTARVAEGQRQNPYLQDLRTELFQP